MDAHKARLPSTTASQHGMAFLRPVRYRTMTTTTPESRARIAYTAYGARLRFRSPDGEMLPNFHDLPADIREAWTDAAGVVWDLATTGRVTINTQATD